MLTPPVHVSMNPPTQTKINTEIIHYLMFRKLNKNRGGFTLVEIMIVVGIIALLAAIAVPNFLRARKRSQGTRCLEDLRIIDSAVDQYAIENNKVTGNSVAWADVQNYMKTGSVLYNSQGFDMFGHILRGLDSQAEFRHLQQALRCVSDHFLVALLSLIREARQSHLSLDSQLPFPVIG